MVERKELRGEINRVLLIILAVVVVAAVAGGVVLSEQRRVAREEASRAETRQLRRQLDNLPGLAASPEQPK